MDWWILIPVILPAAAGIILLSVSFAKHCKGKTEAPLGGAYIAGLAAVLTISAGAALYLACGMPLPGILAVFLFNMTMPVTLWAVARVMPGAKGFTFGLLTFGLFLGWLPSWLGWPNLLTGPAAYAGVSLLSLALLWLPLRGEAVRC